jgi:DNA invertase Pin-like site-specific DNA recombinase
MIEAVDGLRVLGYIRVSTGDQVDSGAGLAAQRRALKAEIRRREWGLEIIEEPGVSGSTLARPALTEALRRLENGEAEVLMVNRLDRLTRSVRDFGELAERARKKGWKIVCLDLGVDTTTPSGELVAHVVAASAQYERRLIGLRTKEALAAKKAAGVRLGRPPVITPEVIGRVKSLRDDGLSLRAIAARLTGDGVPTARGNGAWSHATVQALLRTTDNQSAVA